MDKLKSAKEILESMGFNKEAPESTQMAFLRYLKREMNTFPEKPHPQALPEQLEFNFDEDRLKSGSS